MKINQAFKMGLGIVAAGVLAGSANAEEVTSTKKTVAKPLVKTYGEVQLRSFSTFDKNDGKMDERNPYTLLRPLLGATVLDGQADVTLRTTVKKFANKVEVSQGQPVVNLTVNNLKYGPLTVTPYVEHFLPSNTVQFSTTEFYLDNVLSQDYQVVGGALTLSAEVELLTALGGEKPSNNVRDKRVALGLVSADNATTSTEPRDMNFQHEWNVGAVYAPSMLKGFTVGLQQYVTNAYLATYDKGANGELSKDAAYPLSQTSHETLTLTYQVSDRLSVLNKTDVYQKGFYKGAYNDAVAGNVQNQVRLVYTLF